MKLILHAALRHGLIKLRHIVIKKKGWRKIRATKMKLKIHEMFLFFYVKDRFFISTSILSFLFNL